jgi:hypothetical protein
MGDVRVQKEIMTPVAGFTAGFRLYQREGEQAVRMISPQWRQFMNAKEMIMKRSTIAKTFTIAAVTAPGPGPAHSEGRRQRML